MLLSHIALAALPLFAPDIIMRGEHGVTHELVVETAPELEGWRLYAAPTAGFGGVDLVVDGTPFTFSSKYGTRFYAIPEGEELPDWVQSHARDETPELTARWDAFPSWDPPVHEVGTAPDGDPLQRILTNLRWQGVEDEALVVVGETRWGSGGEELSSWPSEPAEGEILGLGGRIGERPSRIPIVLLLVAVSGLLGLVVLLTRRS